MPKPASGQRRSGGVLRGVSGALSLGLVVLALVVAAAQVLALSDNADGPGPLPVIGHLIAAAIAVACQQMADRRGGLPSVLGVLGVFAVTGAALWMFWWA
ncbi:MAG: hypothetical protein GEU98_20080 [Pseudonocardiaceae bacterium]|nr:hypothetical protein [Pseudonocardiaceae bacterium]